MRFQSFLLSLALAALATVRVSAQTDSPPAAAAPPQISPFQMADGDRIILLGDTLIEREQTYGYLETAIVSRFPEANLIIRNLGWSADTVLGESRASFDPPEKGFERLKEQIVAAKPTVAILGYGMTASFGGAAGLPKFKADMNLLMNTIQETSKDVRFILLSPIRHENLGSPLPDPTEHNKALKLYADAIAEIAQQRNARFVSLFESLPDGMKSTPPLPLTDNGIHLNDMGYWQLAESFEVAMGWTPRNWRLGITGNALARRGSVGIKAEEITRTDEGARFVGTVENLDYPPPPGTAVRIPRRSPPTIVQFGGMKPGNYTLKIDGKAVADLSQSEWSRATALPFRGAGYEQPEALRLAILKKNELFFHRWRPQNETYLFGFRKHEQGRNAREIPMFDPLIAEQEAVIAQLRKPKPQVFELVPTAKASSDTPAPVTPSQVAPSDASANPPARNGFTPQPIPEFQLADGVQIELFAENPLLAKPIQMNFDPQGRLWVASSEVYPQIEPGKEARDKIIVLEDTDGDGKAEKSTVFAEGLLIPTGVEPGDGGVYVGQSTELLHFKDTNGDGKADQRRIVLSGFGTEDTHHILHTLRWGHDGQLYFNQSIYIHSHIETPHGVVRLNSGGLFHLRPPTMELGVFLKGFCNPWGHHFDEFGQSFVTDGAGFQGISFGVPGAMYFTYANMRRELRSISPGNYPKFCGLETLYSEHFPKEWQGSFVTCDFRAHRIVRFDVSEQGSGYVTKEMPDLLRTTNVTFRPIDVKLGPDGALYIADWSNPIIQHGEVDFRDPRRDHEHGRIWRVTMKGRPALAKKNFAAQSEKELLNELLSPNGFNRQQARRVLTEKGSAVTNALAGWMKEHTSEKAKLEALWMRQSFDQVDPALLKEVLAAKDGRIRAAGLRVASFWSKRLPNTLEILTQGVADEHPRARLEAIRALAGLSTARAAELALSAMDKPMDDFINYAIWLTINDLAEPWLQAVKSGEWKAQGREKQLEFGLQAVPPQMASSTLAELIASKTVDLNGSGPWVELIGKAGGVKELQQLYSLAQTSSDAKTATRALAALRDAAQNRKLKPATDTEAISKLFAHASPEARAEAVRLAGLWKSGDVRQIAEMAGNPQSPAALRSAAFAGLREFGGNDAVKALEPLAARGPDLAVRREAVVALSAINASAGIPAAVQLLADTSDEAQALALWRSLLSIRGSAGQITKALAKTELPASAGKAGLRAVREGGRSEPDLILAIARSASLEDDAKALTPEEMKQFAERALKEGNPELGEKIYRMAELSCVACHSIGGVGGRVGPDLTSIGASAPADYLVESLLFPNRKIKEGFHTIVVETRDGEEFSGTLARENGEQIVIRDASNTELTVAKSNIQSRRTGSSLMPSGLIDTLSPEEQVNLFSFLSELGKPGRYDASRQNVARQWKLRLALHTQEQFGAEALVSGGPKNEGWTPAMTLVDGTLTRQQLDQALKTDRYAGVLGVYAATQALVAKDGPVQFRFPGVEKPLVWIDGKPATQSEIDLKAGVHTIVMKLDAKNLPAAFRVESNDATFLTQ